MRRRPRTSTGPTARAPDRTTLARTFESGKTKTRAPELAIPAEWLSALLTLACDLPIEEGPEAVATALVETVGRILPDHGFGLSLSEAFDPEKTDGGRFLRTAPQGSQVGLAPNSDRLFPELGNERVLEMDGEHVGIRVHIGSDVAGALEDGSAIHVFVLRVAEVFWSALHTTRLVSAKGSRSLGVQGQTYQSESTT